MRVHVLFAHPDPDSYAASLHRTVLDGLAARGHQIDDCDLYAEGFNPVLSLSERRNYHNLDINQQPVQGYVDRLMAAEALVFVTPIWNFGFPAILKGYFDRVFLPGVSFKMENRRPAPALRHIRHMTTIATYGATRWRAFVLGDPPRKIVSRTMRVLISPTARTDFVTHYDMNRATPETLSAMRDRVGAAIARIGT